MVSVAAAIAVAIAIAGIAEAGPDVLELMTYVVQDDHERTVGDETALTAVTVLADEVVEPAVSVLAVCVLSFDCAGVYFGHVATNVRMIFNRMRRVNTQMRIFLEGMLTVVTVFLESSSLASIPDANARPPFSSLTVTDT